MLPNPKSKQLQQQQQQTAPKRRSPSRHDFSPVSSSCKLYKNVSDDLDKHGDNRNKSLERHLHESHQQPLLDQQHRHVDLKLCDATTSQQDDDFSLFSRSCKLYKNVPEGPTCLLSMLKSHGMDITSSSRCTKSRRIDDPWRVPTTRWMIRWPELCLRE